MKKVFFKTAILCLIAGITLGGCKKDETPPAVLVKNEQALTQTVYADKTTGTSAVQISTAGAWTSEIETSSQTRAGTDSLWISISPSSGNQAGDYTIAISVEPNLTGADRSATISIICGGSKITITVTQKKEKEDGEIPVAVADVSLNKSELTLVVGDTATLVATITPANADDKTLTWSSSNTSVATVSETGLITTHTLGEAIITVTTTDGNKTASCAVMALPGITMTMVGDGTVGVELGGSGTATLNWGDGSSEILALTDSINYITHIYVLFGNHTVTITGADIKYLRCYVNRLITLDVSKNTALTYLSCGYNQLSTLDVSKNTELTYLNCSNNQLSALVSKNTALTHLLCKNNQLTALDVSGNTALRILDCSLNQLSALDVSENMVLTTLDCRYNQLSAGALNVLFGTLQGNTGWPRSIYIEGNPGESGCNKSIAEDKGWWPW